MRLKQYYSHLVGYTLRLEWDLIILKISQGYPREPHSMGEDLGLLPLILILLILVEFHL